MKNNLTIKIFLFTIIISVLGFSHFVYADASVTYIVSDAHGFLFNGSVALPSPGIVSLADTGGTTHAIDARSALAVLHQVEVSSGAFSISNLQYYNSFNAFYLKCITPNGASEECDNWEYIVNSLAPDSGLDNVILSGGETIYLYFGTPYQTSSGGAVLYEKGPLVTSGEVSPLKKTQDTNTSTVAPAPITLNVSLVENDPNINPSVTPNPIVIVPEIKKSVTLTIKNKPTKKLTKIDPPLSLANTATQINSNTLEASVVKSNIQKLNMPIFLSTIIFIGLLGSYIARKKII